MPTNFICGRKGNSNYSNMENLPWNIKIFYYLMIESLECTFIKKRTLNRHSFRKKQHTHKTPNNKKCELGEVFVAFTKYFKFQNSFKNYFLSTYQHIICWSRQFEEHHETDYESLPGIIFPSLRKKKKYIYNENLNQVLNFGFRGQNKSKYLRSKLKNETQKLTILQKSYKLSSEELKFPSTVVFVPWISRRKSWALQSGLTLL